MKLHLTLLIVGFSLWTAVPCVSSQNPTFTEQVIWRADQMEPLFINPESAYDIALPVLPQELGWMGNRIQLTFDLPRFFRTGEQFLFTFRVAYVARAETGTHKGEFPKVSFYGRTPQGFFVKLGKTLAIDHVGCYEIPIGPSVLQTGAKNLIDVHVENIEHNEIGYGKKPACFVWRQLAFVNRS